MKIGILTQPLQNNYGGLLQAYALQKILKDMGHEVWTIDSQFKKKSFLSFIILLFKRFVLKFILKRKDIQQIVPVKPTKTELNDIIQHFISFKEKYINTTTKTTLKDLNLLVKKYSFDAIVVGSDQVWRPKYSPCMDAYFLASLKNEIDIKRISYAASFGTENWEFNKRKTKKYSTLLKLFDLVTVREDSAVQLCKEKMDIQADRVLDPTLLISRPDYSGLIDSKGSTNNANYILVFVLDKSQKMDDAVSEIADELKCEIKYILPEKALEKDYKNNLDDYISPSVEQWLSEIMNASYIITDSFHGSVFSIIFHKPFLALGNIKRGLSRFESLFNLLNLQNRLKMQPQEITVNNLLCPINFVEVDNILNKERTLSINLLANKLK